MEKYAIAIKTNVYVESFRESILQTVDAVTEKKVKIYDGVETTEVKSPIFK